MAILLGLFYYNRDFYDFYWFYWLCGCICGVCVWLFDAFASVRE